MRGDPFVGILAEQCDCSALHMLPDDPGRCVNVIGELAPGYRHEPVTGGDHERRRVGTDVPVELECLEK